MRAIPSVWIRVNLCPKHVGGLPIPIGESQSVSAFLTRSSPRGLYDWGMSRMSASMASIFINLVPMLAVILGWLVLNEGLNRVQLLASLVVVGGVMLSQRR